MLLNVVLWLAKLRKTCTEFWSSAVGTSSNYALSHDADSVDVFVSHSWLPPVDWEQMMGPPASALVENRLWLGSLQRLPHSMVQKNVETQCGHVFIRCTEDVLKES